MTARPSPPSPPPIGAHRRFISEVPLGFADLTNQQKSLALYLADSLRRDAEFITDLGERVVLAVPHAGPHPQDVSGAVLKIEKLGLAESVEPGLREVNLMDLVGAHPAAGGVRPELAWRPASGRGDT